MIQVICPTIAGREENYERCVRAYEQRTVDQVNFITIYGEPTCGLAWQKGVELAGPGYIHFTADDLEPLDGWDVDARQAADDGFLPAPVIYVRNSGQVEILGVTPDGFFSRIPFCTSAQWEKIGPMIPIHYYTDNWFSWMGNKAGFLTMEIPSYRFNHHWAMAGRHGSEKMSADYIEYERYKREGYEQAAR